MLICKERGEFMLLQLDFEIAKEIIDKEYRRTFISFIKQSLSFCRNGNGNFYEKYYKDTIQKDFTWSVRFTKPIFKENEIILGGNKISVIISTGDTNRTGLILYAAFLQQKYKKFPLANQNFIILKDIKQLHQKVILNENCIFKSFVGSPLCVREHDRENHKDTYYTIDNREFSDKVVEALKRQAEQKDFSKEEVESIEFKPINCKKVVVLHYGVLIDATVGIFEIKAPNLILQDFYQEGLLSRRSQGFGMIDLLVQK